MSLPKEFNNSIEAVQAGDGKMAIANKFDNQNTDFENQNKNAEKTAVSESDKQMSLDALSQEKNNIESVRKAFASMDRSQPSPEASKMLGSTKLTIVDHGALVKAVDEKGYIPGGVENSVIAQVGSEKGQAALADARMAHASNIVTPESNEAERHQNIQVRTTAA